MLHGFVGDYKYFRGMYYSHIKVKVTLKVKVVCSSETLVAAYKSVWHHNPDCHIQHIRCHLFVSNLSASFVLLKQPHFNVFS
jgi:hypothetical protein